MAELHFKERDRLVLSVLLAFVLHALVFILMQVFITRIPPVPEYSGPLFVEIVDADSRLPDTAPVETLPEDAAEQQKTQEEPVTEEPELEDTSVPVQVPENPLQNQDTALLPEPAGTVIPEIKPTEKQTAKPTAKATAKPTVKTTARATDMPTARATEKPVPTKTASPSPTATEESAFSSDVLANLDKALDKDTATNKPQPTAKTTASRTVSAAVKPGSSGSGGTTPLIKWDVEDEARSVEVRVEPKLPDLSGIDAPLLTVEVKFSVAPQGFLTNISISKSSAYTEVDNAVIAALSKYKFKPTTSTNTVSGVITFEIKTR